ncbi:tyrosine-type recombinase/integrase [Paractinoplanes lichenicola]|uniref:tyrosine-type recombinase/integrase n=1 Tax=Paractinoplanes lichenicola TaxID=2802976 RepID=UPI0027DCE332|nr:site-specific integrase [Actinoplanes lichenicola]
MTATNSKPEVLQAARLLLQQMGVSPADLLTAPANTGSGMPSFRDYVPVVMAAVSPASQRMYGTYLNKAIDLWGDRGIDQILPSEIEAAMRHVQAHALKRRNSRGGRSASEHFIAGLRSLYKRAVADGLIAEGDNPARKVAKPRRLASTRTALPYERLSELIETASVTGNDPELDTLILRFHIETACRRGGLLGLRPKDLDVEQCLVLLREKGDTFRWQPISPTLMAFLQLHIDERGPLEDEPLLRYRNGRAVGRRRYNYLFERLGKTLPWLGTQQVSAHWLRHTTLTWGRMRLRLRRRPRLRRTRRNTQRRRHHRPLCQSHPRRSRHRPGRAHRRTPPARRHRFTVGGCQAGAAGG